MIKRIINIDQVSDLLDNERAEFYGGKDKDKDNITRAQIGKMDIQDIHKLIEKGLIVRIKRI